MIEWPENFLHVSKARGFEAAGKPVLVLPRPGLACLLVLEGGGNELIRMLAGICLSEQLETVKKHGKSLRELPLAGAVSLNAVGPGAGETYWTADEVEQDPARFERELIHCFREVAVPWFCAFPNPSEVLKALDDIGEASSASEHGSSGIDPVEQAPVAADDLCTGAYARYSAQEFERQPMEALRGMFHELGFRADNSEGFRFCRWRKAGNLVDVVLLKPVGFGTRLVADVFVWVPEFDGKKTFDHLPEDLMAINGGVLGSDRIEPYPYLRATCSQPFDESWLDELRRRMQDVALPWFESIEDRRDLLSSVREDFRTCLDEPVGAGKTLRSLILSA